MRVSYILLSLLLLQLLTDQNEVDGKLSKKRDFDKEKREHASCSSVCIDPHAWLTT